MIPTNFCVNSSQCFYFFFLIFLFSLFSFNSNSSSFFFHFFSPEQIESLGKTDCFFTFFIHSPTHSRHKPLKPPRHHFFFQFLSHSRTTSILLCSLLALARSEDVTSLVFWALLSLHLSYTLLLFGVQVTQNAYFSPPSLAAVFLQICLYLPNTSSSLCCHSNLTKILFSCQLPWPRPKPSKPSNTIHH